MKTSFTERRFTGFLLCTIISGNIFAQTDTIPPPSKWKTKLQTGLNISEASFTGNWKGGGVNSIAGNALLNINADYTAGKYEWTNDFETIYGNVKNGSLGWRKTADRIFFETKLSYKLRNPWRLFASATFMSQFDAGYDFKEDISGADSISRISGFMSPGYVTEALGFEYKPVEWFSAQFGVGALRQTFVTAQSLYDIAGKETLYGVDRGQVMRNQVVFQFVAEMNKEIMKNITLKVRYLGIADYQKLNGQDFVHRLDLNILAKVNKYINASFGSVLLYDFDQDKDVQFSQLINIGILYTLQNYEEKK